MNDNLESSLHCSPCRAEIVDFAQPRASQRNKHSDLDELTSDVATTSVKPLRFRDFPPEIRNRIYRLLLTHQISVLTVCASTLNLPVLSAVRFHTNILRANKATCEEGTSILYGENVFQAHPTFLTEAVWAMDPRWLVGPRHLVNRIRRFHIRVRLDCDTYFEPNAIRIAFTGLDEFQIEVSRASFGLGDYAALEVYAGVRHVKRARVYGSVDREFAEWLAMVMESD